MQNSYFNNARILMLSVLLAGGKTAVCLSNHKRTGKRCSTNKQSTETNRQGYCEGR